MSGWQDGFKDKATSATLRGGKTAEMLEAALESAREGDRVAIVSNSLGELERIAHLAKEHGFTAEIHADRLMIGQVVKQQPILFSKPPEDFHTQLPVPPSGNRYWRKTRTGRIYPSEEAKAFKKLVALKFSGRTPMSGRLGVKLVVYRVADRGDIDNYRKILYDALEGYAYRNDSQIKQDHCWLEVDKFNPHVTVHIWKL